MARSLEPTASAAGVRAPLHSANSLIDGQALVNHPEHPLLNRCIQGAHPPGSTYKLVTATAALEEGFVGQDTSFFCGGGLRSGNRLYRCWKKSGHGKVNLMKGLIESCDVYFYSLGSVLGPDVLARYAGGFGFGVPTGIDLNDERSGLVPTSGWYQRRYGFPWQPGESFSVAIGQGANQVTPLQLVMAYASVANGGILYRPLCIERVVSVDGITLKRFVPTIKGRVPLSRKSRDFLKECFLGVVNSPAGTGRGARLAHINVAGKTGTAQVVSADLERLQSPANALLDHAWFVAFAPKDESRIAVVVFVEHGGHGGSTAAPIAKKIISEFFRLEGGDHV